MQSWQESLSDVRVEVIVCQQFWQSWDEEPMHSKPGAADEDHQSPECILRGGEI